MSLSYRKFTAEEDKLRGLIIDGQYQGFIEAIEEKLSQGGFDKNGNPKVKIKMAVLDLIIIDISGRERKIKDWTMLEGDMAWKFRHLCLSAGLLEEYDNDMVKLSMFPGKKVIVKIATKDSKDQDNKPIKRSTVIDYLEPLADYAANDLKDDELPF